MGIFSRRHRTESLQCSFCKQTEDAVAKLISSPKDYGPAFICDECVRVCITGRSHAPGPSDRRPALAARCSFCHKSSEAVRLQSSSGDAPNASICEECLSVCRDILEGIAPSSIPYYHSLGPSS